MQVSLEGINVMVAIPGGRNPSWETAADFAGTLLRLQSMGVPFTPMILCNGSIITSVRDKLLDSFLRSDCNRLFWIDDDMRWTPDDFIRLLALSVEFDCVTAAYTLKRDDASFVIKTIEGHESGTLTEPDGLLEIEGVGLGFACMTREVCEAVAANKPDVYDQIDGRKRKMVFRTDITPEGNFRGEDMAFFADVRAAGFKVWCDPSIELGHMGTKEYRGKLLDVIAAKEPQAVTA